MPVISEVQHKITKFDFHILKVTEGLSKDSKDCKIASHFK